MANLLILNFFVLEIPTTNINNPITTAKAAGSSVLASLASRGVHAGNSLVTEEESSASSSVYIFSSEETDGVERALFITRCEPSN